MTDLVLRNAVIVTAAPSAPVVEGGLAVSDGRIEAIGDVPDRAQEVLDLQGRIVAPGLVNAQCHAADGKGPEARDADAHAFFEAYPASDTMRPGVFPHGAYTVGPENLSAAKAMADRYDGLYSVHAAETLVEQATIEERYGTSVIRHMDACGILDERAVLAHCVHLDDEEIAILARTRAVAVHNPVSNLKLASGFARLPEMLKAGVRIALGTDGPISGNDMDMWLALRLAATLHKAAWKDATAISTEEALRMATLSGAEALGLGAGCGSREVGKAADFVVLDVDAPSAVPMFDPVTHLVYSASKADVRHVAMGGDWVVRDRALTRFDMTETMQGVRELVPAIRASIA